MKSSKRVVKAVLSGALVLAMGVTTLFTSAGTSYAAGEAKLNESSRNILTRQSFDFDVDGAPKDAVITWESSDDKIATVDENGVVTGIKKGNVTITCKVTAGGKTEKLTATAKIIKPSVKLEIKNKVKEMSYGETVKFGTALVPTTSNDVVTWTSSDSKVATVDKNGKVKAVKEGKVTITATTLSGKTDSVTFNVYGGPDATPTPKPTAKPTQKPSKPQTNKIELVPLQTEGVTVNGNKATIEPQYRSANYMLPSNIDGSKVTAVKVVFSSDQQICIKIKGADNADVIPNDYPNYGVTAMTEATVTYDIPSGSTPVTHVEFMSLDNKVNVEVKSVEFTVKEAPKPTQKPSKPQADKIDLVAMQPDEVTVDGDKATMNGGYKTAIYPLPGNIDGSKVTGVKVVFSSDQQICIKIKGEADADVIPNDYPNWGVTAMTEATVNYEVPSGSIPVTQVEFMSLDNKVNIEVKSVEFTLSGGAKEEPKEEPKEEVKGTALDLSTAALISGDAPKVSGGKLTFTTNNNKCAFMLPAAVASGDKVTVAADFNFVALEPASVVRFYLINDNTDVALSDVAVISNADVSATDVKKTVTLTANSDANMLLMTNFAWDGSTPQAVTVNGISVQ